MDFALNKDDSYYLEVFLKECKYTEKKEVGYIYDNLSNFSCSSDKSDEGTYFFIFFIVINKTLEEVSYVSFKQKEHNKPIS